MTVTKTRGAARKCASRRIRFGHKLVNIRLGQEKTPFVVHEDLLCSSSKYFKSKLQASRKAIEGDCSICTENVASLAPACFCAACGQNFHVKCIDDWLQRERTCPLCRLAWPAPQEPSAELVDDTLLSPTADVRQFAGYMQWLYTGIIPNSEDGVWKLLLDHLFGEKLQDSQFMMAARQSVIGHILATKTTIKISKIISLYKITTQSSKSRKFLVDLCAVIPNPLQLTSTMPVDFLVDLAQKLLSSRLVEGMDMRQALAEWLVNEETQEEGAGD